MQRFINNWSTTLAAVALTSDSQLSVPSEAASLLIGLGAGDHYVLTLEQGVDGPDVREIVRCTAQSNGMLAVVRGQEGTAALEWPAGTVIEARLTAATLGELQSPVVSPGSGGSDGLTRENFAIQVQNGALGIQSPIGIFALDNVGACVRSADNGALKAMLPWLTTTLVKGLVAVGPYVFRGDNVAGIVADSNGLVALSTGSSAGFGCSAELLASALVSDASDVAPGSFMEAPVRAAALSGGAQRYLLDISLSIPPYGVVAFRYGADYSESVWSVWWLDANGTEQLFVTSRALSTAGMSYPRIEISGSDMVCKEGVVTIHTIPLANLYRDEDSATTFGAIVSLYKVTGSTPTLVGLGTPSGQLALSPA